MIKILGQAQRRISEVVESRVQQRFNYQHFENDANPVTRRANIQQAIDGVAALHLAPEISARYTQLLTEARDALDVQLQAAQPQPVPMVPQYAMHQVTSQAVVQQQATVISSVKDEGTMVVEVSYIGILFHIKYYFLIYRPQKH